MNKNVITYEQHLGHHADDCGTDSVIRKLLASSLYLTIIMKQGQTVHRSNGQIRKDREGQMDSQKIPLT